MKSSTYLESMEEHHKNDKIIDKKELNKVERKLGYHSKSVVKIIKVGQSHGQHKRALQNATVHVNGQIPVMKGSEKDHKPSDKSIKMRPIVNAMDGPKRNLSDIFSDIGNAVIESSKSDVVCYSTEELLESFEAFNTELDDKNKKHDMDYIVGSMDAVSLYPSLEAERSAEIIREVVMNSNITFDDIDIEELGIYLRTNLSKQYINERGYENLLPRKVREKHDNDDDDDLNEDDDDEDLYKYVESIENMLLMNDEVEHENIDLDKSSELNYNRNIYENEEPENKGSNMDVTSSKDVTETEKEKRRT